ncbi:hypothetical protein DPMN_096988 [Dreissena polymorpha]|uniref:Uncharacterized protein n=1 Tax=Dreissena polymorpha TaxID=45954 RepID=A0A9D4R457_DREPO|nr:hypothetical protein DPMN_096988 [Dreissena polymorpha]
MIIIASALPKPQSTPTITNSKMFKYSIFTSGICYSATAIGVACGFFSGSQFMQKWFVAFDKVAVDT